MRTRAKRSASRKDDALPGQLGGSAVDEIVLRALAKWPNVPSVYSWLSLDRRGNWLVKGERIANAAVVDFIGRNYEHDAQGRWFFQNGPQRVFVKLAYTPLVFRIEPTVSTDLAIRAHTGRIAYSTRAAWIDERGDLLVETELGAGLIEDRDLALALDRLTTPSGAPVDAKMLALLADPSATTELDVRLKFGDAAIRLGRIRASEVPARFSFDPDPRPGPGEPDC